MAKTVSTQQVRDVFLRHTDGLERPLATTSGFKLPKSWHKQAAGLTGLGFIGKTAL